MTALVWFTRDLRVHDHPALRAGLDRADDVICVFCLDDRLLGGRNASGPRTQFVLECLADLDERLERTPVLRVRRYVPELRAVPDEYPSEPWAMPEEVQRDCGCVIGEDYPEPIVDHREAPREAFERYAVGG